MTRLRLLAGLALAWVAGYAMRRPPPAPCPDEDDPRVAVSTAGEVVDLAELQRSSYRAGEADGRAASLSAALRLADRSNPDAWRQGYHAGWEEMAAWCLSAGHPAAPEPAPAPDGYGRRPGL